MTAAGKRLDRAVRQCRELQSIRMALDAVQVSVRELEQGFREELREARADVLLEETRPATERVPA